MTWRPKATTVAYLSCLLALATTVFTGMRLWDDSHYVMVRPASYYHSPLDVDTKQWCAQHGGLIEIAPAFDCVKPLVPPASWFDHESAMGH